MSGLNDREKAFEDKFAHDETMTFKARARRDKLFGEWLGAQIGLSGDALAAYGKDMVVADLEEPGDDDVIRKARADIEAKGLDISDHMIQTKLASFLAEAKAQLMDEG